MGTLGMYVAYPDLGLGIGPSSIDPRTGEILFANIVLGEGWIAALNGNWLEKAALSPESDESDTLDAASGRLSMLHAMLVAQGSLAVHEPLPDEFIRKGLTDIVTHEVGH